MNTKDMLSMHLNYKKLIAEIQDQNEQFKVMLKVAQCESEKLGYLEAIQKNEIAINELAKERLEYTWNALQ